uniref:ribonuclease Z n=1 Tax=Cannabis sativa TaxID=3483 RepID=A0A803NZ43_CANSA
MEGENKSSGSNKRTAEERDKDDPLKSRKLNSSNTICYLQILGNGMDTHDTSPSVLLFFDSKSIIFNAGEGLQRFCTEQKIPLSKIHYIFLTRVCSETAGGLPGLLLTLDRDKLYVRVRGPSDLKYLVDALRSFIPNAALHYTEGFGPSHGSVDLINDQDVKISAIVLQPTLSEGQPGDMSVVYVCELPEIKGRFDDKKALALGVGPGPNRGQLVKGISVKSDCQDIMVHPSDVMGPSLPGPIVLIVDCPKESHLQQLLSTESFNNYFSGSPKSSKAVSCIVHLSPASVVSSPKYHNWMARFGSAQHIMAGHERKNIKIPILKSSARFTTRLSYLCPQFFPGPESNSICSSEDSDPKLCESIAAENLQKFVLRPHSKQGLDKSCVPSLLVPTEIIDELHSEIPDIAVAAQNVRQLWHTSTGSAGEISSAQNVKFSVEGPWLDDNTLPSCLENIGREDLEIIFLGTGSSQPSKYRNVSSIHINIFSKGGLLLDCGEGTLGQLKRRYGVDKADDVVRGLRCIWISHMHADHHAGLARILAHRRELLKETPHEPILVVGPGQLKNYLDAYQRLEDLGMMFLDCQHTTKDSLDAFRNKPTNGQIDSADNVTEIKSLKKILGAAGLEALISFSVFHCKQAFGVVLKAAERINSVGKAIPGWKIVYSGDTRPCKALIEASRDATILIHEATFEDGKVEDAVKKNHSTSEEAVKVGNLAGAYRILLTHFSQRYPKISVFDEMYMHNVGIAFDMMSVNLADLPALPKVLPYLKILFRNEIALKESDDIHEL